MAKETRRYQWCQAVHAPPPQLPPHTPSSLCHPFPVSVLALGNTRGSFFCLCKMQVEKTKPTKLERWAPAVRMDAAAGLLSQGSGSAPHQVAFCPSPSPILDLLWIQSPPASDPIQNASLLPDTCSSSSSEIRGVSRQMVALLSIIKAHPMIQDLQPNEPTDQSYAPAYSLSSGTFCALPLYSKDSENNADQ